MADFKPDFNRLKKVLLRLGEPDILPFYELYADKEIMEAVTGKPLTPESLVEFYYTCGYDYATSDLKFGYEKYENATSDTAELRRDERRFVENNRGIIENREDFDKYEWPAIDASVANHINQIIKYLPSGMKTILHTCGGILENVMMLMGYIPFSYALCEDEQLVWDMFEKIGSNHVKAIKTCLDNTDLSKVGAVVMGDDMGFNHSTMISPEDMRKYVFPWQKKVAELVHSYDLPMILHSCGNLEAVMDDLIDYVGIDAKHSFEDKIMPVTEAKKKYGNRIAILGGMDMNFLCTSSEEEVRQRTRKIIAECAPGGNYALGTGNSVANYVPLKNYLAMLDEGRKCGVYPINVL
ncbi:MAG TPA: uroporphyrinogen-III decarboxylase-like protein [Clostridiaceae bacterium]|nr:uroporphyrinogen-III decarboxylase-like protein [Clostridiaceae bacterium]